MKKINVLVIIEMRVKGEDIVEEVKTQLEVMDTIIGISELESDPRIFIEGLTTDNILEPLNNEDE